MNEFKPKPGWLDRQFASLEEEDLRVQITDLKAKLEAAGKEISTLRGAMAAQDERERNAGQKCGVPYELSGCDWPEAAADEIANLTERAEAAERELDELKALNEDQLNALLIRTERDEWKRRYDNAERSNAELRAALQAIKDNCGQVCSEYETCRHAACDSSYAAWATADAALTTPPQQAQPSEQERLKAYNQQLRETTGPALVEAQLQERKARAFDWLMDSRCGSVRFENIGTPGDDEIEVQIYDVDEDLMSAASDLLEALEAAIQREQEQPTPGGESKQANG